MKTRIMLITLVVATLIVAYAHRDVMINVGNTLAMTVTTYDHTTFSMVDLYEQFPKTRI